MPAKRKAPEPKKQVAKRQRTRTLTTQSTGSIFKTVFPVTSKSLKRNLRFTQQLSLNSGVSTTAVNHYRANGCFDPDFSVGGHQPRGYDQYCALYNRWVVTKSKITVMPAYVAGGTVIVGVEVGTTTNSSTDIRDHCESQLSNYAIINTVQQKYPTQTFDLSVWKPKSNVMADDGTHGVIGADPSEQFYFTVFTADINPSSDPAAVSMFVTIEYEVTFFDPIVPLIS